MYTEPVREYLTMSGVKLGFRAACSALWRGYIGSWEIVDGQLYLIGLGGTLQDGASASLPTVSLTLQIESGPIGTPARFEFLKEGN